MRNGKTTRVRRTCTVGLTQGLHIRPVQRLADIATAFRSEIRIATADREALVDSVMALMALGIRPQQEVEIQSEGEDANQTARAIQILVENEILLEADEQIHAAPAEAQFWEAVARLADVFDSEVGLRGEECSFSLTVPNCRKFSDYSGMQWDVRAAGPDAEQASEVVSKLLSWVGLLGSVRGVRHATPA